VKRNNWSVILKKKMYIIDKFDPKNTYLNFRAFMKEFYIVKERVRINGYSIRTGCWWFDYFTPAPAHMYPNSDPQLCFVSCDISAVRLIHYLINKNVKTNKKIKLILPQLELILSGVRWCFSLLRRMGRGFYSKH
jgi:hypothetical protein